MATSYRVAALSLSILSILVLGSIFRSQFHLSPTILTPSSAVVVFGIVLIALIFVDWRRLLGREDTAHHASTPKRSAPGHVDIFPPSNRHGLLRLAAAEPERGLDFAAEIDEPEFRKHLIGWEDDWRKCPDHIYLPSGVTLGEIRALGAFPNYAALSDVPLPEEHRGFNLKQAVHRPYRPFRWPYHQTMSLMRMEPDWWLELEQTYEATVRYRMNLWEKNGKGVLDQLPGVEYAARELMEMALQFYAARHPQLFTLTKSTDRGWVFRNSVLRSETVIEEEEPLHILMRNIPEDFAIVLRNPADGKYYFRGGVICSALGWNLASKLGLQLKDVHGPIPDYKEKMEFSMDRYFSTMPCNKPIQRGSWGLEVDKPLYMPPGDPHEAWRDSQDPQLTLDRIHLRVDWQTLRRLPLSGAIVFNFKGVFSHIEAFRDEPGVPALVTKLLTEGKPSIMKYKNTWHTEHVAIPALVEWADEQVQQGSVPHSWKVTTLDAHPFFNGWEEKWRKEQGM